MLCIVYLSADYTAQACRVVHAVAGNVALAKCNGLVIGRWTGTIIDKFHNIDWVLVSCLLINLI